MTEGLLFVCAVVNADHRARFDDWYDRVHLPGRMQVPGFRRALRYRERCEGPRIASVCIYQLESAQVLRSAAYLELQADTADDTAVHTSECAKLHRIVGELDASDSTGVLERPSRMLRATVIGTDSVDAEPLPETRRTTYRIEWEAAPALLRLEELGETAGGKAGEPAGALASWTLELTDSAHGIS